MKGLEKKHSFIAVAFMVAMTMACSDDDDDNSSAPELQKVSLNTSSTFGQYLTDADGKTLYYFTSDFKGLSTCEGGCLAAWPAFFMESIQVGAGLNAADFTTITRADGSKQTTYKGWPLYYFAGDAKTGDIQGDDVDHAWYVAKPDYSLMLAINDADEQYLVDDDGRTLYYFTNDGTDFSNCKGGCVTAWPLFLDETLTLPSFLSAADFKTIIREDGVKQTSFKGRPLYYFAQDQVRGEAKGQGVNGVWFVFKSLQ